MWLYFEQVECLLTTFMEFAKKNVKKKHIYREVRRELISKELFRCLTTQNVYDKIRALCEAFKNDNKVGYGEKSDGLMPVSKLVIPLVNLISLCSGSLQISRDIQ